MDAELLDQRDVVVLSAFDLQIDSQERYKAAADEIRAVKAMQETITNTFRPIIESITKSLEEARAQRDEYLKPLMAAEAHLKAGMTAWYDEQRERAILASDTFGEAELPSTEGIVYRDLWSAEVEDFVALVKAAASGKYPDGIVIANEKLLNKLAREHHERLGIPGVRAVCKRSAAARAS